MEELELIRKAIIIAKDITGKLFSLFNFEEINRLNVMSSFDIRNGNQVFRFFIIQNGYNAQPYICITKEYDIETQTLAGFEANGIKVF